MTDVIPIRTAVQANRRFLRHTGRVLFRGWLESPRGERRSLAGMGKASESALINESAILRRSRILVLAVQAMYEQIAEHLDRP